MGKLLKTWSDSDLTFMTIKHFQQRLECERKVKELNTELNIMGKEIKRRGLEVPVLLREALNLDGVSNNEAESEVAVCNCKDKKIYRNKSGNLLCRNCGNPLF